MSETYLHSRLTKLIVWEDFSVIIHPQFFYPVFLTAVTLTWNMILLVHVQFANTEHWLTMLLHIWEVPDSNLGPKTGHPD
jgi:hypothetical protein